MLHELAQEKLARYGGLQNVRPLDAAYIAKWRGRLPDSFVNFWEQEGLGSLADGSLWFCEPEEYSEVLAVLFGADKDFSHKDCHVVAYSAFSQLFVWSERHRAITIDLQRLLVICDGITDLNSIVAPERNVWSMIVSMCPDRLFDTSDAKGNYLYKRAKKKLGPLAPGEVYGFFPALTLGGAAVLDNLQKVSAPEHFSILAQLDTPVLWDFKPWPPVAVRPIG